MIFPQQFPSLTIPTGAGPGQQRITINQNQNGAILVYDSTGAMIISIASAAGVDESGNAYQAGVTIYSATTAINFLMNDGTWTASDGSKIVVEAAAGAAIFFLPQTLAGNVWFDGDIITQIAGGNHPALVVESPSEQTFARSSAISLQGTSKASNTNSILFSADSFSFNNPVTTYGSLTPYTPTVTGGGTATFSTQFGEWTQLGPLIFVHIYLVVNVAGSGAATVNVDMPVNVNRTGRQTLPMHCESVGPNGSHVGDGQCVFFTGGAGATSDRLRNSSNDATNRDLNITGADLLAGGTITIEGWFVKV